MTWCGLDLLQPVAGSSSSLPSFLAFSSEMSTPGGWSVFRTMSLFLWCHILANIADFVSSWCHFRTLSLSLMAYSGQYSGLCLSRMAYLGQYSGLSLWCHILANIPDYASLWCHILANIPDYASLWCHILANILDYVSLWCHTSASIPTYVSLWCHNLANMRQVSIPNSADQRCFKFFLYLWPYLQQGCSVFPVPVTTKLFFSLSVYLTMPIEAAWYFGLCNQFEDFSNSLKAKLSCLNIYTVT